MTKTLTVEGTITAVDIATNLTSQGSVATPSVVIPAGVSKIVKLIVGIAPDMAAAGSAGFFVRLDGNGVLRGEQVIAVSAAGGQTEQAGGDPGGIALLNFILEDVEIDVAATDTVSIRAEMAGADLGTAQAIVTLVFE